MNDSSRSLLRIGSSIRLFSLPQGRGEECVFEILSVAGEGGSTVAYQAIRRTEDGCTRGILKEYYPLDDAGAFYSLYRDANNQLVADAGSSRSFGTDCDRYLSRYRLLERLIAEDRSNDILRNYTEASDTFYGFSGDCAIPATVYCFSASLEGIGFDQYIAGVHEHPDVQPEKKLQLLLQTLLTLTNAVSALQSAGILHLDLKPSNFLVAVNPDGSINAGQISLFDINTIRHVEEEDALRPTITGSFGYCAPEVSTIGPNDRSDVYSLGAILFKSIVLCPADHPDGLYRKELYGAISRLLHKSRLIAASDINSDPLLCSRLARMLEKTLADNHRRRYNAIEELQKDVQFCLYRITELQTLPTDEQNATPPLIIFQKLLYRYPLYRYPEGNRLDILLLGAGAYAQGFLDAVLQAGQSGIEIHVTAVSDQPESDREAYLRFRPMLPKFIAVEGHPQPETPYGYLRFLGLGEDGSSRFSTQDPAHNDALLHRLFEQTGAAARYCFVSLGTDHLNSMIAHRYAALAQKNSGKEYPVFYVKSTPETRPAAGAIPVWIREPLNRPALIAPDLENMAFNTHLAWMGSNYDPETVKQEFLSPKNHYYYASSLASALSIPYKLFGLGLIDADADFDPYAASRAFRQAVLEKKDTDPQAAQDFDRLVWYEHRRWLLEKICQGWQPPLTAAGQLDLESCLRKGSVKDEENCLHPCLVHSVEAAPLSTPAWKNDRTLWDTAPIDPSLDPLDRMSVELHRLFMQKKEELLAQKNPLQCLPLQELRAAAAKNSRVFQAFLLFETALKGVLAASTAHARRIAEYSSSLAEAAAAAYPENDAEQECIKKLTKAVHAEFFPLIEAVLCRNYKANDQALILNIPFILTNRPTEALAMPFSAQQNAFANAAAATLLNPAALTYFYYVTPDCDPDILYKKLRLTVQYLSKRKNRCTIHPVIGCAADAGSRTMRRICDLLEALQTEFSAPDHRCRLPEYTLFECGDPEEMTNRVIRLLQEQKIRLFDVSVPLFTKKADAAQQTFLRRLRSEASGTNLFTFDTAAKRFVPAQENAACAYLQYLTGDSFLRVEDALALTDTRLRPEVPEFLGDIDPLWRIFTGKRSTGEAECFATAVAVWQGLCRALAAARSRRSPLARLHRCKDTSACMAKDWFIPGFISSPLRSILKKLAQHGVIGSDFAVTHHSSDTCLVHLSTCTENIPQLDALFAQPHRLLEYYRPCVTAFSDAAGGGALVQNDELQLRCLLSDAGDLPPEKIFSLLDTLQESRYLSIAAFDAQTGVAEIVFGSSFILDLLCRPEKILTYHVYSEALRTGFWNDLALCTAEGEAAGFDLMLCRDFGGIVCLCTDAFPDAQQLRTFEEQAMELCPNHIAVIITAAGQPDTLTAVSASGPIILHQPDELQHIGDILQRMMCKQN